MGEVPLSVYEHYLVIERLIVVSMFLEKYCKLRKWMRCPKYISYYTNRWLSFPQKKIQANKKFAQQSNATNPTRVLDFFPSRQNFALVPISWLPGRKIDFSDFMNESDKDIIYLSGYTFRIIFCALKNEVKNRYNVPNLLIYTPSVPVKSLRSSFTVHNNLTCPNR